MSINSGIYNYVEENGRTYHRYKEGSMLCALLYIDKLLTDARIYVTE